MRSPALPLTGPLPLSCHQSRPLGVQRCRPSPAQVRICGLTSLQVADAHSWGGACFPVRLSEAAEAWWFKRPTRQMASEVPSPLTANASACVPMRVSKTFIEKEFKFLSF